MARKAPSRVPQGADSAREALVERAASRTDASDVGSLPYFEATPRNYRGWLQNPFRTTLKPWETIARGYLLIIPGFGRCSILSIL